MRLKEIAMQILDSNLAILRAIEIQQLQNAAPVKEMMLGNVDTIVQRYKELAKQRRQAIKQTFNG